MMPLCPHEPRRSTRLRDAALWGSAALIVLFAHVSSAAWLLSQMPVEVASDGPPPAIMIELAAEPEAVNTEMTEVSTETEDAQEVAELTPPEPPVEELVSEPLPPEPEPVQETTQTVPEPEPLPEPVVEQPQPTEKLVEKAEIPLPPPPPEPVKPEVKKQPEPPKPKKVVVKQEKPKDVVKPQPAQPSKASVAAAAEVAKSERNASTRSSSGSATSSVSPARWQSKVQAHLARRKGQLAKSRDKGTQGTVLVRFSIDTGGNVLSVSLSRSSGYPSLDQDVLAMVRAASPVPAPPPDVNRTLTVPFEFTTR